MAVGGGVALKFGASALRGIEFLAAIIILGIFSYFLVFLQNNNLPVYTWVRAVEGISGAAALYTLIALVLTCCLGGITLFAFIAILLDIAFAACFIAVIALTKGGATTNCSNIDTANAGSTDLYNNPSGGSTNIASDDLQRICDLEKVTFVIAIIELVLFLISALVQLALGRHHQREKRKGYTSTNTPVEASSRTNGGFLGRFTNGFGRNKQTTGRVDSEAAPVNNAYGSGAVGNEYANNYGNSYGNNYDNSAYPVRENATYENSGYGNTTYGNNTYGNNTTYGNDTSYGRTI